MPPTSEESQTQSTEPGTTSSRTRPRRKSSPAFSPTGCPQVISKTSRTRRKKEPGYVSETATLPFIDPLPEINRPEDAAEHLRPHVTDWHREHFILLMVNARNRLLGSTLVSIGSLSASIVHPREVFKPALLASAAGIVVGHNHPSGDSEPSPEDVAVTRRLSDVGTLLGVELLDHVVFTQGHFVSMKGRGHL